MSSAGASRRDGAITDNHQMDLVPKMTTQPVGGISSSEIPNIGALVNSLCADIKHIKN